MNTPQSNPERESGYPPLIATYLRSINNRPVSRPTIDPTSKDQAEEIMTFLESVPEYLKEYPLSKAKEALLKIFSGLNDDDTIVTRAVKIEGRNIDHASERLQGNKSTIMDALATYPGLFRKLSDTHKHDVDIALACVRADGRMYIHNIPCPLKNNPTIAAAAVEFWRKSVEHNIPNEIINHPDVQAAINRAKERENREKTKAMAMRQVS